MAGVKLIPLEVLLVTQNGRRRRSRRMASGGHMLHRLTVCSTSSSVRPVHETSAGRPTTPPARSRVTYGHTTTDTSCTPGIKDGSENFRLYDVDLETGVERDLTPRDDVQCRIILH